MADETKEWTRPQNVDELDEAASAEEYNYQQTRRVLGESLSLFTDVIGLYDYLADLNRESRVTMADTYPAIQFMLDCRVRLTKGVLEAARGHLADAMAQTRRAIEACGMAVVLRRDPTLEETWAKASDDDETYRRYRKAFQGKVPPRDDADTNLSALRLRYDMASKLVHVTLISQARRLGFDRDEKSRTIRFGYVELDADKDRGEPFRTIFWTLQTHTIILRVFAGLMSKAVDHDRSTWEVRSNAIDGKLTAHFQQWLSDGRLPLAGE